MPFQIYVDRDECIGAGTCVECAPRVFQLDDEDIAIVINASGNSDEAILQAAQDCPQQCIYLFDESGEEQLYP